MIEYEVKGTGEAIISMRAINEKVRAQIIALLREAAQTAEADMLARVPRGKDKDASERTVAGSIDVSEPVYHPGGAGGGGSWEVRVGPGVDAPTHLRFLLEGTGIHGPEGNLIKPHGSGPLAFDKGGEGVIFRMSSEGQRPQTEWLEEAQQAAREAIAIGVHRITL